MIGSQGGVLPEQERVLTVCALSQCLKTNRVLWAWPQLWGNFKFPWLSMGYDTRFAGAKFLKTLWKPPAIMAPGMPISMPEAGFMLLVCQHVATAFLCQCDSMVQCYWFPPPVKLPLYWHNSKLHQCRGQFGPYFDHPPLRLELKSL